MLAAAATALVLLACGSQSEGGAPDPLGGDPPPAFVARQILDHPDFDWRTETRPNLRVHVDRSVADVRTADRLADETMTALEDVLRLLGAAAHPMLDVFYVSSRERVEALTGRPARGLAYPGFDTVVLVSEPGWRPFARHELTHVLAYRSWGQPGHVSANEGVATLAEAGCAGTPLRSWAKAWSEAGTLPSVAELVDRFTSIDELTANVSAAAYFDFVRERAGVAGLRRAWSRGVGSVPEMAGLGGTDDVERAWREWLDGAAPAPATRPEHCGAPVEWTRPPA